MELKRHWLGQKWYLPGAAGNDIHKVRRVSFVYLLVIFWCMGGVNETDSFVQTNVPDIRLEYRRQTLVEELKMIGAMGGTDSLT